MRTVRVLLLFGGMTGLLSACGSGGGGAPSKAELAQGKKVFTSASCGTCHSLTAAGAKGVVGGPLDGFKFKPAFVEQRVREGGGGMPAFGKKLSDDQIKAVSAFVSNASGG